MSALLIDGVDAFPTRFRQSLRPIGEHGVRMFSGRAVTAVRKYAREWDVATAFMGTSDADALEAKLLTIGTVPVSGDLIEDSPSVACLVTDVVRTPLQNGIDFTFSFRLIEADP